MSTLDKGQDKEGERKARSFNEKIKHLYRARFRKSLSSSILGEDEERETKKQTGHIRVSIIPTYLHSF